MDVIVVILSVLAIAIAVTSAVQTHTHVGDDLRWAAFEGRLRKLEDRPVNGWDRGDVTAPYRSGRR